MSFICGLSTMATLIVPPLAFELVEPPPPPPQPATTIPTTTTSTAVAVQRPLVPLISVSSPPNGAHDLLSECGTYTLVYVGCQGAVSVAERDGRSESNSCRFVCSVFILREWVGRLRSASARISSARSPSGGFQFRATTARGSGRASCTSESAAS